MIIYPAGHMAIHWGVIMNIIVVGIGNVGFTATLILSKYHDVMIIDDDKMVIEKAKSLLNVSVLYGDGTSPKVLESAIRRHGAKAVVSTTGSDENNLLIGMVSKVIDPSIRTIARIRSPDFVIKTSEKTIDDIISPEIITAKKRAELAMLENAVDYDAIESMDLALAMFEITEQHTKVIGKSFLTMSKPDDCSLLALYRNDEIITDCDSVQLQIGDKMHILGSPETIDKFNDSLGVFRHTTEVVIIGGGVAGEYAAKLLESRKRYVKIFEINHERCSELSKNLNTTIVVNASGVDPHLLKGENVGRADVLIATTDVDETNLLSCLMGLKLGSNRVISRYSMVEYEDIFDFTGVRTTVGTFHVVANEITKLLIEDENSIIKMKAEGESLFTAKIDGRSKIVNQHYGDIKFPDGCRVGCILRNGEKIFPQMDTIFLANDILVVLTYNTNDSKVSKLLRKDSVMDFGY